MPHLLDGFARHSYEELGFSIDVDADWEARPLFSHGQPVPTAVGFGRADGLDYPAVSVSVGQPDGKVWLGNGGQWCREIRAWSLDELASAVVGVDDLGFVHPPAVTEVSQEIVLGGEPAVYEWLQSPFTWAGFPAFNHVLAVHHGRPIILSFDRWTFRTPLGFNERQIVENVRFLD